MPLGRLFSSLNISATGLSAQRRRMDTIAQNIANAETTRTEEGGPYRRQVVVTSEKPPTQFNKYMRQRLSLSKTSGTHFKEKLFHDGTPFPTGTRVSEVARDPSPPRLVYDPTHPDANEQGYVAKPNFNVITEMVDMMTATRAYEANITALNASKDMSRKALDI
ncbi:MAG: flagellar basal body rod protein FlgC [Gemmatimonadota bacterium]|nr:flagellar basal body rod protein FlgC [Gemmatimonadota bacterium]